MRKPIDHALQRLCEIYDKKRTSALEEYWDIGLSGYSDDQIVKALKGYYERNENPFFPTPKEFIQYKFLSPSM